MSAESYTPFMPLILIIILIVFLALREFWCWYFKINQIKGLLTSIDKSLSNMAGNSTIEKAGPKKGLQSSGEAEVTS